jgi:hypothetical protein
VSTRHRDGEGIGLIGTCSEGAQPVAF